MRLSFAIQILLTLMAFEAAAGPAETHKPHTIPNAGKFHACHFCHSLKEGVHLTGPSLANIWGKKAGHVEGFNSYTEALKKSGIVWNEKTMAKWIDNPEKLVPGTTMKLKVHYGPESNKAMIEFLKIALGPKGFERVVDEELEQEEIAGGQIEEDSSKPGKGVQVTSIVHCKDTVTLKYADGHTTKHWEMNVGYKTDSSVRGPPAGKPVLVETGSLGDRFQIVFRNAEEIRAMVKSCP